jgi:hypothetical protein
MDKHEADTTHFSAVPNSSILCVEIANHDKGTSKNWKDDERNIGWKILAYGFSNCQFTDFRMHENNDE